MTPFFARTWVRAAATGLLVFAVLEHVCCAALHGPDPHRHGEAARESATHTAAPALENDHRHDGGCDPGPLCGCPAEDDCSHCFGHAHRIAAGPTKLAGPRGSDSALPLRPVPETMTGPALSVRLRGPAGPRRQALHSLQTIVLRI